MCLTSPVGLGSWIVRTATAPDRTPLPLAGELSAVHLEVRNLDVELGGSRILRDVSVSLQAGRTLALLGPSGCGKTTLLRTIAGLQDATGGVVSLDGTDVSQTPAERRGVGMVFQDGALFPHLDVRANIGFGLSRSQRRSGRVARALELVGLSGFDDRMPSTLSGGQQQRVALARALVTKPRVLLLDEPFSALDTNLRTQVRADVAELLRTLSVTTVVVTHDQEEAFLLGDEVAVMVDGTIHQQAPPADLYGAPATRQVADFLGDANMVTATADGQVAQTWFGEIPLRQPATGAVQLLVRPEHLAMSGGSGARVAGVEYYGHDAVSLLDGPTGRLRVRTMSAPPYGAGDMVDVRYVGPPAQRYTDV